MLPVNPRILSAVNHGDAGRKVDKSIGKGKTWLEFIGEMEAHAYMQAGPIRAPGSGPAQSVSAPGRSLVRRV